MADTLSNKFILALEPVRDHLYTVALGVEGSGVKAEAVLQKGVRGVFPEFAKDAGMDVAGAMESAMGGGGGAAAVQEFMPADVWARLAAAVQLTAAQVRPAEGTHALNPDSVLLSPDPLLAPKKPAVFEDDDLPAPSRFLVTSVIAVVLGVVLSVYIMTRPAARAATRPASEPATEKAKG